MLPEATLLPLLPAALVIAALTVPTGFGTATLLVLWFFPPHEAIALVAVVHGLNNGWKLWLFRGHVAGSVARRFAPLMIAGALMGAALQGRLSDALLLMLVGLVLLALVAKSLSQRLREWRFGPHHDRWGGLAAGLLGGLSGHQGALRSSYLVERLPTKEGFVATAALLAVVVDATRLPVYALSHGDAMLTNAVLLVLLVAAAFTGSWLGRRWLRRIEAPNLRRIVLAAVAASGALYLAQGLLALA